VKFYTVYRSTKPNRWFRKIMTLPPGTERFEDRADPEIDDVDQIRDGKGYYYYVEVSDGISTTRSSIVGPVKSSPQFYHRGRTNIVISVIIFVFLVLLFINRAKRGKQLYIRPIAGINAVEEAIGRSTEMGRPILYVPGLSLISDVATLASISILSHVAERAAQYDTRIIVPNYDPVVYSVMQEVVKQAYLRAGRPDAYREENVFFLSPRQFAYAAGVNGIMVRERPATNFFMGMFYAESLLMAETGASTGAIQIAGTDAVTQLPFFITACDYTLIGEELYAAGAYLGREPSLLGSLKGQDWSKVIIVVSMILGMIFTLLGYGFFADLFKAT
jgi:hypothetical protein